jgi:hypothetical protein
MFYVHGFTYYPVIVFDFGPGLIFAVFLHLSYRNVVRIAVLELLEKEFYLVERENRIYHFSRAIWVSKSAFSD